MAVVFLIYADSAIKMIVEVGSLEAPPCSFFAYKPSTDLEHIKL